MKRINVGAKGFLLLLFLCILTLVSSAATNASLGVKGGDWVRYGFQEAFSSAEGQWLRVEFRDVSGTNVSVDFTVHLSSDREYEQTKSFDVATGEDFQLALYGFGAHVHIVPSGLSVGDSVYLGGQFGNRTVAGEATRSYAGMDRTVVYANFSQSGSTCTFYWDKQTGVLTEGTMIAGSAVRALWITETNIWNAGFIWWPWVIIAVVLPLCFVVAALNKRTKARMRGQVNPTSEKGPDTSAQE